MILFELKNRGLMAESQVPLTVFYRENRVGEYFADIVVEEKVIVERRTVEQLDEIHENY